MPTPVVLVWALPIFLYLIPYFFLRDMVIAYTHETCFVLLLVISLFSSIGFTLGWNVKIWRNIKNTKYIIKSSKPFKIFLLGFFLSLLGITLYWLAIQSAGGIFIFYGSSHSNIKQELSGYLFEGIHIGWIGIISMSCSFAYLLKNKQLDLLQKLIMLIILIIMIIPYLADTILIGQRGGLIVLSLTFVSVLSIYDTNKIVIKRFSLRNFGLLFCLLLLVLGMPSLRHYTHLGEIEESAIERVEQKAAVNYLIGSTTDEGNELLFACGSVCSITESMNFDSGLKFLYLPINFLPRSLFKDKPTFHDFSVNAFDEIYNEFKWRPVEGSVETGIADVYARFFVFAPFFWFLLAILLKYFWYLIQDPIQLGIIRAGINISFIYLLSQNFYPFGFRLTILISIMALILITTRLRLSRGIY